MSQFLHVSQRNIKQKLQCHELNPTDVLNLSFFKQIIYILRNILNTEYSIIQHICSTGSVSKECLHSHFCVRSIYLRRSYTRNGTYMSKISNENLVIPPDLLHAHLFSTFDAYHANVWHATHYTWVSLFRLAVSVEASQILLTGFLS